MKNIMTLEEFLDGNKSIEELNEGLLSNLFGALFKKDMWGQVKGGNEIKKQFKEIDDSLSGFDLTKIKNPNASQNVRQTLVSWADDIYDAKKKAKEDGAKLKELLKEVGKSKDDEEDDDKKDIKDEIKELNKKVDDIDKKYQKTLDDFTKDPELKRWSDLLKNQMGFVIDRVLCGEFDKEGKFEKDIKEIEKKNADELKKDSDEMNAEMQKALQEIKKLRDDTIKKCGAKPLGDNVKAKDYLGQVTKAITSSDKLFEDKSVFDGKSKINIQEFKNAKLIDLLGINAKQVGKNTSSKALYKTLFLLNEVIISNIENDFKSSFENIGGSSLQAAFVSYCNLIMSTLSKATKIDDNFKDCMARCSVLNNTMVGFGLPCPDKMNNAKSDDQRSLFAYYINETLNNKETDSVLNNEQKTNLNNLCKEILDRAKKLVEDYDKEQQEKLKKEEQEQEKKDKEEGNK